MAQGYPVDDKTIEGGQRLRVPLLLINLRTFILTLTEALNHNIKNSDEGNMSSLLSFLEPKTLKKITCQNVFSSKIVFPSNFFPLQEATQEIFINVSCSRKSKNNFTISFLCSSLWFP